MKLTEKTAKKMMDFIWSVRGDAYRRILKYLSDVNLVFDKDDYSQSRLVIFEPDLERPIKNEEEL